MHFLRDISSNEMILLGGKSVPNICATQQRKKRKLSVGRYSIIQVNPADKSSPDGRTEKGHARTHKRRKAETVYM